MNYILFVIASVAKQSSKLCRRECDTIFALCTLNFEHKFFPCNRAEIRIKFNKIHAENKPPFFRQMGGMNVA